MDWLKRLLSSFRAKDEDRRRVPSTMLDLKGGDPCWCGSGKKYRHCHRAQDRRFLRVAGRNPFV